MAKPLSIALVSTFLLALLVALLAANGPANNPQEAARLNNIGVAYMNQQLFEKALKAFEEAAANDPALEVATVNRGVALLNLQRLDEAKAQLEKAAKSNPKDAHAWYNLGLYYKNSSDAGAAVDAFRRVTEIDPGDADTWYFLGSTYAQLKQFPEAIAAFGQALKLNPLHASAQFGLARAYQQSGQADPAHEAMKKFQYITQNKLGAPISLAYGEQGKYSRAEDSPVAVEKVGAAIPVRFVDVTKEAGLDVSDLPPLGHLYDPLGPGACFVDYDGDGRIDLFLSDNGPQGGMTLYHNLGNGKFENVTVKAGLDEKLHGTACSAADYDNDGFTDLAVVVGLGVRLLHNEKNGTFRDVTDQAGITRSTRADSVTFVDYDHDGDVDLFAPSAELTLRPHISHMWRNNGNGTFTDVGADTGLDAGTGKNAIASDVNNDRAVDLLTTGTGALSPGRIFLNRREGAFQALMMPTKSVDSSIVGIAVLDFDHDQWMDLIHTGYESPAISLWHNNFGKTFEPVKLPETNWARAFGVTAIDYDNDGWVDLVAVGETKEGKGEVRLFRNLGPDGWKDVTADVGLDKIELTAPRAIIAGDYDNDGAVDLLITQNHGPAVLLHNEGGNKNNSLRLALKGLSDNKSAIGTKVEVFSAGLRQKFEVYGSSGYLGQNSPYLTIGLGQTKVADVVRLLWPTGVLQDEIEVAANKLQNIQEIDRRGSSCPTLFAWNGHEYELVGDMLGAGVVGHWIAASKGKVERNIARPTESIKLDRSSLHEKDGKLSFRFMEPLEESVYLDQVQLLAVDHPADVDVYPNEYFASNPPYPPFKVVFSNNNDARPPAGAWDEHGHDVLPDLLAHRYIGDFKVLSFMGFTEPHSLELDLGEPYRGGPLWLLLHGEIEYFSATSMYAADQAHLQPFAPYVEAPVSNASSAGNDAKEKWVRVVDDMGFPAGGARTMTADLTGKLPPGTRRIRITTNLQIYWDNILISRTSQDQGQSRSARLTPLPLARAELSFHGFPLKIEGQPPGNVKYIYEKASATGPYTRPAGAYTRYGDVRPLLDLLDDKFVVFGSGDEVALDFDPAKLPALPRGWVRDYFFVANGYEKDMDFYAYRGDTVEPLPFRDMDTYPYPGKSFPSDAEHLNYLLEYNTRFMSGNEASGYSFQYPK
ncbi:MAG TPA: FG-GAP-like repeat-containing protein [Terriglobales bacterium]|jgi:tetratricopeptide (TPR) repeat protein|nr:FG-GAP-like repeat-containing protein [Terriglobales bacterium]